ncbi:hypothetical protein [Kribbella sp. NPDC048915]|uniref:hypothetical protein n=1 Tax=Kribbella sp. NPDC048915 TaxID=3155148 RepID=UPI0033E6F825
METTASVVAEINVALGIDHRIVRQLTGGLQSTAYELTGGVVLKWTANPDWAPRVRRAAELVRRARAVGYPTPAWVAVGTTAAGSPYQLQEFVHGTPPKLDLPLAKQVVEICELQRDLMLDDHELCWSDWACGVVFDGWDGVWSASGRTATSPRSCCAGTASCARRTATRRCPATISSTAI